MFYRASFSTQLWSAAIVHQFSRQASVRLGHVYHYTTTEGLKGIIESKSLWASGAYYLNDRSEIEYGCDLTVKILEENAVAGTKFARKTLDRARCILTDSTQRETRMATYYVACFCENGDLPSQWRAYSGQEGFAVGFRVADIRQLQCEPMTVALRKVLYDKADQEKVIRDSVAIATDVLRRDDVVRGEDASSPSAEDVRYAGEEVAQMLLWDTTFFKTPDFAEEHEWRLMCQPRHSDDREKVRAVGEVVSFRATSRGLIPYIELACPHEPDTIPTLPIDSVRFGPTQTPHLARSATRMLLDANGFQSVQVVGSNISTTI